MDVKVIRVGGEAFSQRMQLVGSQRCFHFVFGQVASALELVPVAWQIAQRRFLSDRSSLLLRRFQFGLDGGYSRLNVVDAGIFRVDLPQRRMFLDRFVEQRLGDGGIV